MVSTELELVEAFAKLHANQRILKELNEFKNSYPEFEDRTNYEDSFVEGIEECIEIVTEIMEEQI